MTLWRSFWLHFFWCFAIIASLVLSDEVYPWASDREPRSYVLDAAVPQSVDPAQHLEQMKKSCVEETVRRRLNSDICARWVKLHDAALSKKGQ